MLSIGLITSSQQARRYYEKDDYYLKNPDGSSAQGEWYGRGATALSLSGAVDLDGFVAILDGVLPNGQNLSTAQGGTRKHTPGWDLTFSAPKSVSILVELGHDERLIKAHEEAVKAALDWVEAHAVGARQRSPVGRLFLRTNSMVAALFTHHTSRNQDPDLHTHSVLSNVTEKGPGAWAAVHSKLLYQHKMAAGMVYRAEFAQRILQLGYTIESTGVGGLFEVADVPKPLIKALSSRREQIKDELERTGREDAASASRATLRTRARKGHVDRETLEARWKQTADAHEFDPGQLVAQARGALPRPPPPGVDVRTALQDAIDRLSEAEAAFFHRDLVRFTLAGGLGRIDVAAAEAAIRQAENGGRLHRADEAGIERWTTPQAKEQEKRIIEAMMKGRGVLDPMMGAEEIDKAIAERPLKKEQRETVQFILSTRDRITQVRGLPGTGKTSYVLKTVNELASGTGFELFGIAQNANAARTIELEAGISSATAAKHLNRVGPALAALRNAHPLKAMYVRWPFRKQLWVIDEAAQMPNNLKRRLFFAAERLGVRVVSIGDPGQFGAIEAGKPFELLLNKGVGHTSLVDMQRTRNPVHLAALKDAQAGRVEAALVRLRKDTYVIPKREARLAEMLETWRGLRTDREATLLLTARNAEKRVLNQGVREILKEEGRIEATMPREQLIKIFSRRADRRGSGFYQPGWIVRFSRDIPSLDVKRNEYRQVLAVDPATNTVLLGRYGESSAAAVAWNPRQVGGSNKRATELFKLEPTELAPGEPVRWARNSSAPGGPINGQMLNVVSVDRHTTTFATNTGERMTIDHRNLEGRHWDHAYASTIYSAQGKTVPAVLVNADSDVGELFSQKAFTVALSRHQDRLALFTDDVKALTKTLREHLGSKTSAIEALEQSERIRDVLARRQQVQDPAVGRGRDPRPEPDPIDRPENPSIPSPAGPTSANDRAPDR